MSVSTGASSHMCTHRHMQFRNTPLEDVTGNARDVCAWLVMAPLPQATASALQCRGWKGAAKDWCSWVEWPGASDQALQRAKA
jgi:hypothetical protein